MRIVTVVGARPQFIKAAAVSQVLRRVAEEYLVHTGQHYDDNMSSRFFEELDIPKPDVNLGVGSGLHGAQTAAIWTAVEAVLLARRPDCVLVYGDTNSTLAGALAASKLRVPVAHVEAGVRSFYRKMPEEINRILVDHVSDLLLCPTAASVLNLAKEGIRSGVHLVGDVMRDALLHASLRAGGCSLILKRLHLQAKAFYLATVHRAENTDEGFRLSSIFAALDHLPAPVVLPLHPRTRAALSAQGHAVDSWQNIVVIPPVGYLDMVHLEASARLILTDSGGVQKEALWLGVPCVTLRDQTEWPETVESGWNVLAGADVGCIVNAVQRYETVRPRSGPDSYVQGTAARLCVEALTHEV